MRIGCDVQSVGELRERPSLLGNRAVFSPDERGHCDRKRDRSASLAGILCAKEACLKSLYGFTDLPRLTYRDVEIGHAVDGRPVLRPGPRLAGWLAARALAVDVSISHSGDYAMATAVVAAVAP
jgi:phosphopantetheine--protein transferase-like protein